MTGSGDVLEPLDRKSATLFLAAGGLLVVFAANTGARVFADGGVSAVHAILGPGGFFLGVLGLLGRYPALAGRAPSLARAAGVVAAIPAIGWFLIALFGAGNSAGVLPGVSVVFPAAFPILVFLTTVLAYVLFGVASLGVGAHSRAVSLALLVPAVPFLALIVGVAVLGPVEWAEFVIDSGHALAHLGVGLALRSRSGRGHRAEPAADATP